MIGDVIRRLTVASYGSSLMDGVVLRELGWLMVDGSVLRGLGWPGFPDGAGLNSGGRCQFWQDARGLIRDNPRPTRSVEGARELARMDGFVITMQPAVDAHLPPIVVASNELTGQVGASQHLHPAISATIAYLRGKESPIWRL